MRHRIGLPFACLVTLAALIATATISVDAQVALPTAVRPTGADLFMQQCATCHSLSPSDPARQGPHLAAVFGRKPGSVAGFHYSPGYAAADFVWDEAHLDLYLTDPQAVIPGAIMLYKQKNAEVRRVIIAFLKQQK
jgi:cytochrome c